VFAALLAVLIASIFSASLSFSSEFWAGFSITLFLGIPGLALFLGLTGLVIWAVIWFCRKKGASRRLQNLLVLALGFAISTFLILWTLWSTTPEATFRFFVADPIPASVKNIRRYKGHTLDGSVYRLSFELSPEDFESLPLQPMLLSEFNFERTASAHSHSLSKVRNSKYWPLTTGECYQLEKGCKILANKEHTVAYFVVDR